MPPAGLEPATRCLEGSRSFQLSYGGPVARIGRRSAAGALGDTAPMSQANVEIVRQFVLVDLDEALTYADREIIWNPIEEPPTQGHDAVRANLARWESEWDDYEVIPEEFLDLGDRVVVTLRLRGRGHGSGVEIDALFYEIYTLRDGKIIRMDEFTDRADALEAAGPAE